MHQPNTGDFCWNELATANVKAAKDFYGKIFGWEFTEHEMGDSTYTMVKSGDKEMAGIWEIPNDKKNEIPPHWLSYILVDDLEKTLQKAESLGATIKVPVMEAGEFGRLAILIDPAGAHIAFWESKKHKQ